MSRYQHTPDEHRILRAIANMPYGGMINGSLTISRDVLGQPVPITLDKIAQYLEVLGSALADISDEHGQRDLELQLLRADRAACRRWLGLPVDVKS